MFRNVAVKVATEARASGARRLPEFVRSLTGPGDGARRPFDASLLGVLVCPLSKKPLRYDADTNELINEELGIAYPITDGIPNMIPQEARLIQKDAHAPNTPTPE